MRIREKHIEKCFYRAWSRIIGGEIIVAIPGSSTANGSLNIAQDRIESYSIITDCDVLMSPAIVVQKRTGVQIETDAVVHVRADVVINELSRINIGGDLADNVVTGGVWFNIKKIDSCDFLVRKFLGKIFSLAKDE